jgi:hypothetical protein
MSRRLTKYMKNKTMNTYCPKCEAEAGQPCHGVNGGWANLHEERKSNARKRFPIDGPVKKRVRTTGQIGSNKEIWDALPSDQKALVMGRVCPLCQAIAGAPCKSGSGNHVPMPHKERMVGESFLANPCPTCGAGKNVACTRPGEGKPYQAGYIHAKRRELLAPLGGLTQISYAPAGVKPPKAVEIIGDEEDVLEPSMVKSDKSFILTGTMCKDLADHLRGIRIMTPETIAAFADMLDHIPTPVEVGAAKLAGLDLEAFFDQPWDVREEFLLAFREAMGAYMESLFDGVSEDFPQAVMDKLLVELV